MILHSMTGFSRAIVLSRGCQFIWELKSVNSKGLDMRLRCPSGFDALEPEIRSRLGQKLSRGTVYATLNLHQQDTLALPRINEALLKAFIEIVDRIPLGTNIRPASLDGILALKGIVEPAQSAEFSIESDRGIVLSGLETALDELVAMRMSEGEAIGAILTKRILAISKLVETAEANPARQPSAIAAHLSHNLAKLLEERSFDIVRLHQEAVLLATKADIREELDRLVAHVAAVRILLGEGGPVGRRLDFLAQELSREVNTLCAKSNDISLTSIGLDLKTEVEQFREQVQNIE